MNPPVPEQIFEADFLIDYFRFASRINGLSAIANYEKFDSLKDIFDKRALFVSQQSLLLSSAEDLALFLNAIHDGGTPDNRILPVLAEGGEAKTSFPRIFKKIQEPMMLLKWVNLSRDKLIQNLRDNTRKPKNEVRKWIDQRILDIQEGVNGLSVIQEFRDKAYNKTKHGKPIISFPASLLDTIDAATESDGPAFYFINKRAVDDQPRLRSHIFPYSDEQFIRMTRNIIAASDVFRDLIYLFILEHHPAAYEKFQTVFQSSQSLRSMAPGLFP